MSVRNRTRSKNNSKDLNVNQWDEQEPTPVGRIKEGPVPE